jgi:ABC-type Fe3+ transport system substrate-binding protein
MGKLAVALFIAACLGGAYYYLFGTTRRPAGGPGATTSEGAGPAPDGGGGQIALGVAYGTEKERWLEWAVEEFAKTRDGRRITVDLIPKGSIEAAHALLAGDRRIHVWSPASAAYTDAFTQEWQLKHGKLPILRQEALALTPMVFVMWEERYEAFLRKYGTVSFATIAQAMLEKGGWDAIAAKPEWGLFKYGHADPGQSNSGLQTIVLAAYGYHGKTRDLAMKDVLDTGFQTWLEGLERGVTGLTNSTGTMMREMVLKGPSSYDVVFVYESVAIDFLKNAEGRWGRIRIVYPEYNAWNENPYYVLDTEWSSDAHRRAADEFLRFLVSEPVQKQALVHGFRPGNPSVPVRLAGSPFVAYAPYGVQVDLRKVCDPPKADVINTLLTMWQRMQPGR